MKYHLTRTSGNAKTGPIPVSTSHKDTCPDHCALKGSGGCYADTGPLGIHWNAVSTGARGRDWPGFLSEIRTIPAGTLWRHNQAGDLPHDNGKINGSQLFQLTAANHGKRGFTYTHHCLSPRNVAAIRRANSSGFTVNVSADSVSQAVRIRKKYPDLPVVSLTPEVSPKFERVGGELIVTCPAVLQENRNCANCQLCQDPHRDYIIGFPAHGSRKKKADLIAKSSG